MKNHFLCYDADNAISSIEEAGVPEGSLKPIIAELYSSLKKDVLFIRKGENPLKYFVKYQQKSGYQLISDPESLSYEEAKKVVNTLNQRFFSNSWYVDSLRDEIIKLVIGNKKEDWLDLFKLTKSYLTELINLGYDARWIVLEAHKIFYRTCPISSPNIISDFLCGFDFKEKEYDVIAIVDRSVKSLFGDSKDSTVLSSFTPRTKSIKEINFLNKKSKERYVIMHVKAVDPFSAASRSQSQIDLLLSIRRMMDHDYKFEIEKIRWGVYDSNNWFIYIQKEKSAVQRVKMPPKKQMLSQLDRLVTAVGKTLNRRNYRDITAVVNALKFHSLSLDSNSKENQLLDLWAIFETLLDIQNNHTNDRIQQVCIYLVPILKRKYIYALFSQLSYDIKNFSEEWYHRIVGESTDTDEIVKKVCSFVLLPELSSLKDEFLASCDGFPLLRERIEYYARVLATPKHIFDFIEKHSERVRWQIMRIYRNRNLIIHNADSMPYLSLLVENLHAYVDDFLEYAMESLAHSHSLESMCQELFAEECEFMDQFQRSKEKEVSEKIIQRIILA